MYTYVVGTLFVTYWEVSNYCMNKTASTSSIIASPSTADFSFRSGHSQPIELEDGATTSNRKISTVSSSVEHSDVIDNQVCEQDCLYS